MINHSALQTAPQVGAFLCLLVLLSSCTAAQRGQAADATTTVIGLAAGYKEANPIGGSIAGVAVLFGLKALSLYVAENKPPEDCYAASMGLAASGYGAATHNIVVIAGGASVVGIPIGLVAGGIAANQVDQEDCYGPYHIVYVQIPHGERPYQQIPPGYYRSWRIDDTARGGVLWRLEVNEAAVEMIREAGWGVLSVLAEVGE